MSRRPWTLDPDEVTVAWRGRTATRRKARQPRELDVRSIRMTLRHKPTGVEVAGEIPEGHHSKKELQRLRDELQAKLFRDLESEVARVLRVAGR